MSLFPFMSMIRKALDAVRARVPETVERPTEVEASEGPLLLVDCYWGDHGKRPNFRAVAGHRCEPLPDGRVPRYAGVIIKATEGTVYRHRDWFLDNWKRVAEAGGERYGRDWFRGCYHFLNFPLDGRKQAEYYVRSVEAVGGWREGDILPIVDVEWNERNQATKSAQIVKCCADFADRVTELTGRHVIMYGGRAVQQERGIDLTHGISTWWNASYTRKMRRGPLRTIDLWQYAGDDPPAFKKLPWGIEGFGKGDTSVYIGPDGLEGFRRRLVRGEF